MGHLISSCFFFSPPPWYFFSIPPQLVLFSRFSRLCTPPKTHAHLSPASARLSLPILVLQFSLQPAITNDWKAANPVLSCLLFYYLPWNELCVSSSWPLAVAKCSRSQWRGLDTGLNKPWQAPSMCYGLFFSVFVSQYSANEWPLLRGNACKISPHYFQRN